MKVMKICAIATVIVSIMMLSFAVAMSAEVEEAEFVEIPALVIATDCHEDVVTCIDHDGNIWEFYEVEDWMIGDTLTMTVWTPTNEIVDVWYNGWIDVFGMTDWINAIRQ